MMIPPVPANEAQRALAAAVIDRDIMPDPQFDDLVLLASTICRTPIAVISFITADRQVIKARVGINYDSTPREVAFCAYTVAYADRGLFVVADAWADERFKDHPAVRGEPQIRFYAGAPVIDDAGRAVGSICVIDRVPRALTAVQEELLTKLSRNVLVHLQSRNRDLGLRVNRPVAGPAR